MKNTRSSCLLLQFFVCLTSLSAIGQTDSLVLKNKDIIVGEIKSMTRNVLTMKTDYSKSDFKIKWLEIEAIYSHRFFIVMLSSGRRLITTIHSDSINADDLMLGSLSGGLLVKKFDVVDIEPFGQEFWGRFSAALDFGYNYTKNNNLQQLSVRSSLGYVASRWSGSITFDAVRSVQDSANAVKRTNGNVNFQYVLKRNFFWLVSANFLQNDEQLLALRSATRGGLGKYLIRNNAADLAIAAGGVWNNERFTTDVNPDRNSAEAFFGIEANLFNTGDLTWTTTIVVYPSLTESGRIRADIKSDLKYDFPYDIYVRLGYTQNYDNQPATGGATNDFVVQTSVGWSFD